MKCICFIDTVCLLCSIDGNENATEKSKFSSSVHIFPSQSYYNDNQNIINKIKLN